MSSKSLRRQRPSRFSLLLLQHNEVLLSDIAVNYHFIPDLDVNSALHPPDSFPQRFVTRSARAAVRGQVRLATHSIFFDCDDWRDPILRIPLESVEYARPTRDNSRSRDSLENEEDICRQPRFDNQNLNYNHNQAVDFNLQLRFNPSLHSSSNRINNNVHNNVSRDNEDDDDDADNAVLVVANSVVYQRELGVDHPYIDVRVRGRHIFTPLYSSSVSFLDDIITLLRAAALGSSRARTRSLRDLVQQREARVPFDLTLLEHGARERTVMDAAAASVHTVAIQPGRLRITRHNVYFMPIHGESSATAAADRIPLSAIRGIRTLRHGCRDAALEISFTIALTSMANSYDVSKIDTLGNNPNKKHQNNIDEVGSIMLSFQYRSVRTRAIQVLSDVIHHFDKLEKYDRRGLELALTKWRNGTMSNFEYLMYLNLVSGRSFNDLSQYPVFPWVIQDYNSTRLDLNNAATFRDLHKPVGALNEQRFKRFQERYNELILSAAEIGAGAPPAFFYGTHYSTPAYVINYLVRAAPAAMLRLQNGRFDTPDRLFHSVTSTWHSVTNNPGDVKELIPEFYTLNYETGDASGMLPATATAGEFLDNVLSLDLGMRQDGIRVDDVELPPWANGSSFLFVRLMRQALESEHVSRHLHAWIDLIFGVKSRNADAGNVFFTDVALPPSIEDVAGTDEKQSVVEDDEEMDRIETMYLEFGRTPQQLFQHPHPQRYGDSRSFITSTHIQQEQTASVGRVIDVDKLQAPDITNNIDDSETEEWFNVKESISDRFERSLSLSSDKSEKNRSQRVGNDIVQKRSRVQLTKAEVSPLNGILAMVEGGSTDCINREEDPDIPVTRIDKSNLRYIMRSLRTSTSTSISSQPRILDICLVLNNKNNNNIVQTKDKDEHIDVCTVWDNDYLKIHNAYNTATLRSKFVPSVNCVADVGDGVIAYGTRNGSIGIYHMHSGRNQILSQSAHESDICVLTVISNRSMKTPPSLARQLKPHEQNILLSASRDGSVKVWKLERLERLRFVLEVDAENCVEDMCAIHVYDDQEDEDNKHDIEKDCDVEDIGSKLHYYQGIYPADLDKNEEEEEKDYMHHEHHGHDGVGTEISTKNKSSILLAVCTSDTDVLVWELDLCDTHAFPEPIWRHEHSTYGPHYRATTTRPISMDQLVGSGRRRQLIAWLRKGQGQMQGQGQEPESKTMQTIKQGEGKEGEINKGRKPTLVCSLCDDAQCLKVWDVDNAKMASAQMYLQDSNVRAVGVPNMMNVQHSKTSRSQFGIGTGTGTVLVAGSQSDIAEFDSTGLCIHRVKVEHDEIAPIMQMHICLAFGVIVVWDVNDCIYTLNMDF